MNILPPLVTLPRRNDDVPHGEGVDMPQGPDRLGLAMDEEGVEAPWRACEIRVSGHERRANG